MTQYYRAPQKSGAEYVYKTSHFRTVSLDYLTKFPKLWGGYFLEPIARTVTELDHLVRKANAVYVSPDNQTTEQYAAALRKRIELLEEAMRCFPVFESDFDVLMTKTDLMTSEFVRLRDILRTIVQQEKDKDPRIEITVKQNIHEIEYASVNNSRCLKLGFTTRNRDAWITAKIEARDEIKKKYGQDKNKLKMLGEQLKEAENAA